MSKFLNYLYILAVIFLLLICLLLYFGVIPYIHIPKSHVALAVIDPGTAILVGAGVGALANGISSLFGASSQADTNRLNQEMFYENLRYDKEKTQFLTDYDFEKTNWQTRMNFLHDIDMFEREADLKSYKTQRRQMEEAGLNPALMFSSGNLIQQPSASASNAGQGGAPSSTGGSSIPQMRATTSAAAEMISAGANAVHSVTAGLKDIASANEIQQKLQPAIENLGSQTALNFSQIALNNQLTHYNSLQNVIQEARAKNATDLANAEVAKVWNEVADLGAQCYMHSQQGDLAKAQEALAKVDEAWHSTQNEFLKQQLPYAAAHMRAMIQNLQSGAAANVASATQSYATAENQREQAHGQRIDNAYKPAQNESNIANTDADAYKKYHDSYKTGNSVVDATTAHGRHVTATNQTKLSRKRAKTSAEDSSGSYVWKKRHRK